MTYLQQRIRSFGHAFRGLILFFKTEAHARIHLLAFIVVVSAGFWFGISKTEWLIILLISALVFAAEIMNTAFEMLIDHIHPELHPQIKKVKDVAAGAVLAVSLLAIVVGIIVFGNYLV